MKIIIRILRTFKNILFPKIYMPWEQNDLDNVSSAELQELFDNHKKLHTSQTIIDEISMCRSLTTI